LFFKSQRYSLPSSLPASTELVAGSTAAELMHHSFTPGNPVFGVGPRMVSTSFIVLELVSV